MLSSVSLSLELLVCLLMGIVGKRTMDAKSGYMQCPAKCVTNLQSALDNKAPTAQAVASWWWMIVKGSLDIVIEEKELRGATLVVADEQQGTFGCFRVPWWTSKLIEPKRGEPL